MRAVLFAFLLCVLPGCSRKSPEEVAAARIAVLTRIDPETFRDMLIWGRYYDGRFYTGVLWFKYKSKSYTIPNNLVCDSSMSDSVTKGLVLRFAAANGVGEDSACIFVRNRFAKAFAIYPKLEVEKISNLSDSSKAIIFSYPDQQDIMYCPNRYKIKNEYWAQWLSHAKSFRGKWFYGKS